MWRLVIFAGLWSLASAAAGELESVSVEQAGRGYKIEAVMQVRAKPETVMAILIDHKALADISDMLVRVHASPGTTGVMRRRLNFHACLLSFCLPFQITDVVRHSGPNRIHSNIIPEQSDFSDGITRWTVEAAGKMQSRIHFYAEMQPDFWVPPLIGPALIKAKLTTEIRASIATIERMAGMRP